MLPLLSELSAYRFKTDAILSTGGDIGDAECVLEKGEMTDVTIYKYTCRSNCAANNLIKI